MKRGGELRNGGYERFRAKHEVEIPRYLPD
jgi:hypothetical protein